jgi:hypothetical protein
MDGWMDACMQWQENHAATSKAALRSCYFTVPSFLPSFTLITLYTSSLHKKLSLLSWHLISRTKF